MRHSPPLSKLLVLLMVALSVGSLGCHSFLRDHAMKFYQPRADPVAGLDNPNAYQADFLYLRKVGQEVFPIEDRYFPPDKRTAMEKEILKKLGRPGCSNDNFLLCVQAYLSGFNCQHAYIADNPHSSKFNAFYPFRVHYVSNELFLSNIGADQDDSLIGQKITAIDGKPIFDVEQKLFVSGNAENLCTKRAALESAPFAYSRPDLYRFAGLSSSISNAVELEFADHPPVRLAPTWKKDFRWRRDFQPPNPITTRGAHQYDLRVFPEQKFAYFQFNACFDKTAIVGGLSMVRPWARPLVNAWLRWQFHREKPSAVLKDIYDPDRPVLKDYLASAIRDLSARGITNLIIDLRHNAGGEGELTKQLIYHLTDRDDLRDLHEFQFNPEVFAYYDPSGFKEFHAWYSEKFGAEPPTRQLLPTSERPFFSHVKDRTSPYYVAPERPVYKGNVILLVNQNTGSAAAILAGLMQDNHLALLVGTTAGNNPTGPTGMTPFRLPHSRLVVSLPTEFDERAQPLNGETLQPDYWVEDSIEDLLAGRDAAFEKALDLLGVRESKAGPVLKEEVESAISYLKSLKTTGRQPGWSKRDKGEAFLEEYSYFAPKTLTINVGKRGDSSRYHYTVARTSSGAAWQLQRAWRSNREGRTIEQYSLDRNRLSLRPPSRVE